MKKKVLDLLNKFKEIENKAFNSNQEFLAPAIPQKSIIIKIEGIIMNMSFSPKNFCGWGIFKPKSPKEAELVREANLNEKRKYLDIHPRFIAMIYQQDKMPYAIISQSKYKNMILDGKIRILLPENISIFDSVVVRWDGQNFWYDEHYAGANLINNEKLKNCLNDKTKPELINIPNITPLEKTVYELAYENVRDKTKDVLNKALTRSGGKLLSYVDRGNSYTVTYMVDGQKITSTVDEKLRVQSAGICLSGGDKYFDLQSLVHIIREGQEKDRIVEGDYSNYYRDYGYYDEYK